MYRANRATNEDFNDYSLTLPERNSWWMVDLLTQHSILGLEITNIEDMDGCKLALSIYT